MKPWRLTPQAENSLTEIATWTINHFGSKQAILYRDELINCINRLASDSPPQSRNCEQLMQGHDVMSDLYYCQQGRHFIVFRQTEKQLEILEFFHQRMDLPTHIRKLTKE